MGFKYFMGVKIPDNKITESLVASKPLPTAKEELAEDVSESPVAADSASSEPSLASDKPKKKKAKKAKASKEEKASDKPSS